MGIEEKDELISVIVPVYNAEEYVGNCLYSILNGLYQNVEVICIDDGSNDNSRCILENFANNDSRIKIISKSNEGVSAARNDGIKMAKGKFISFVDADDWVHSKYLHLLYHYHKKYNAEIVGCLHKKVHDLNGNTETIDENQISVSRGTCRAVRFNVCGKIYSADLIKDHWFDIDISYGEDLLFNTEIDVSNNSIAVNINAELYYYHQHESSAVHTISQEKKLQLSERLLKRARDDSNDAQSRRRYLIEGIKRTCEIRYLGMFTTERDVVNKLCSNYMKEFRRALKENGALEKTEKNKYWLLTHPTVYRMFRVMKDPTMLKWEQNQRKQNHQM